MSDSTNLYILSSNREENIKEFLVNNNMNYLKKIIGNVPIFKKGKSITQLLSVENLNIKEVIYVGDEVRDIDSCREIGIKILSVGWGYNSPESLKTKKPDFFIEKPQELLKIN